MNKVYKDKVGNYYCRLRYMGSCSLIMDLTWHCL